MKKIEREKIRWLIWASSITLIISFLYILLHSFESCEGQEEKYLNRDQLSTINSLIAINNDSTNTKKLIIEYLKEIFIIEDTSTIINQVNSTELKQLQIILPTYPIKVKSYFWLDDPMVLLEIVFWSLFGLLANLMFSVAGANEFDPRKIPEHIGKFFYTPFLAIVIYLAINALANNGSVSLAGVSKSVIVLSFILGFYTRRTIVLLGKVKDLILPDKGRGPEIEIKQEDGEQDDPFKKLSYENQKRIINEFISTEADQLKEGFSEIQGFSARPKMINGLEQDYYCLHIDVIEKIINIDDSKKLPTNIDYIDSNNIKYIIHTDVTGIGENQLSFSKARFIGENQFPKQLGLSCSRIDSNTMGTIGLKVYKNGEPYLLSCYHILCAPEMNKKESMVDYSDLSEAPIIISPGKNDGSNRIEIANVTEGKLNNFVDAAIAKLKNDDDLDNTYFNDNGHVRGTISLTSDHVRNNYGVKLFGRTSGRFKGELIDNYQGIVYFKDYPSSTLTDNKIYNMIVTERISKKGDSGATVVDKDNKVIGMLIGDSDTRSYIIPINTIISRFNLDKF